MRAQLDLVSSDVSELHDEMRDLLEETMVNNGTGVYLIFTPHLIDEDDVRFNPLLKPYIAINSTTSLPSKNIDVFMGFTAIESKQAQLVFSPIVMDPVEEIITDAGGHTIIWSRTILCEGQTLSVIWTDVSGDTNFIDLHFTTAMTGITDSVGTDRDVYNVLINAFIRSPIPVGDFKSAIRQGILAQGGTLRTAGTVANAMLGYHSGLHGVPLFINQKSDHTNSLGSFFRKTVSVASKTLSTVYSAFSPQIDKFLNETRVAPFATKLVGPIMADIVNKNYSKIPGDMVAGVQAIGAQLPDIAADLIKLVEFI
jgi:hypothetical protein